jgi:hypothetical protein
VGFLEGDEAGGEVHEREPRGFRFGLGCNIEPADRSSTGTAICCAERRRRDARRGPDMGSACRTRFVAASQT